MAAIDQKNNFRIKKPPRQIVFSRAEDNNTGAGTGVLAPLAARKTTEPVIHRMEVWPKLGDDGLRSNLK